MIMKTTTKVAISFTPRDTKKYPKYVGRKLLLANSISVTEMPFNWSLGNFNAIKKLKAVKTIGIETKSIHEK